MFQALQSSAGAGKTHTLVRHYLCLALASPADDGYRRILALTFTNKAAAEMRERVLAYLSGLAADAAPTPQLDDVSKAVQAAADISATTVKERAHAMRTHMLHHWSQVAITTIDAFTRRVVTPFARDLRLDSELRMTTEQDHYRHLAVERLLAEAGAAPELTTLLNAICAELLEQERAWRADKPLEQLAGQLTQESALLHLERIRHIPPGTFISERDRLRQEVRTYRDKLRQAGERALAAIRQAGIPDEAMAGGARGVPYFLRELSRFHDLLRPSRTVLTAHEKNAWTSAKGKDHANTMEGLAPLLHETVELVQAEIANGNMHLHALRVAMLRDLLTSAALHLVDEQLEAAKRTDGVVFFSDLTRKVAEVVERERAPFLFERIGERYSHFLIDEFQDTSMLQWRTLLPLITDALGSGGSALLVGDAKQAIYRWRNGEVRQFVQLPALFGKERMAFGEEHERAIRRAYAEAGTLDRNFRSAPVIVEVNNALFEALRTGTGPAQQQAYSSVSQQPVRSHEGLVHVRCYPDKGIDDDGDRDDPAAAFALASVQEAMSDGAPPDDIVVLVRTKRQGALVAGQLLRAGLSVIAPDGLSLGNDPATALLVAMLRHLHAPSPATATVVGQWLQHPSRADATLSADHDPARTAERWWQVHPRPEGPEGLVHTLHRLMHTLELDPAQDAFLLTLLEEARAFTLQHGEHIGGFLEQWDRTTQERSVEGSPGGAVRVMTVHASKGLQFPVVVVPWAEMAGGPRSPLWVDTSAVSSAISTAIIRPNAELDSIGLPELAEEQELDALDRMNLLYVAFTRAETRLYAGITPKGKTGMAARLREHFGLSPGDARSFGERAPLGVGGKERTANVEVLAPTGASGGWSLAVRSQLRAGDDPLTGDARRRHGTAMHAILAQVRTAEDLPTALRRGAASLGLNTEDLEDLRTRLEALLASDALKPFFGQGLTVFTETTLIDADGRTLRPDRVVCDQQATRVLDLKTGARDERHLEQVRTYADQLARLTEGPVSAHLLYLDEHIIVDA